MQDGQNGQHGRARTVGADRSATGRSTVASIDEALTFLRSSDGRAAASGQLRRVRLADDLADDVLQQVALSLERLALREVTIEQPVALARKMIHDAAVNLVRSRARRSARELAADRLRHLEPVDDGSAADHLVAEDAVDELRRQLHLRAADDPGFVSTALTFVSITADQARIGQSCPRPAGHGADPTDEPVWAALWYGGHRDVFASDGGRARSTAAQQRRRLAQRFRDRLRQLVSEVRDA